MIFRGCAEYSARIGHTIFETSYFSDTLDRTASIFMLMDNYTELPMARENNDTEYTLDDVDRGVLYALQRDARNTTAGEIADEVDVSASTVRNRIANLEAHGIVEGYNPKLDYEKAGFTLRTLFVATAPARNRNELAREALSVPGVIDVREMLTSQRNLYIEAVATNTNDLAQITNELTDLGLELLSSEIVANHYVQPFGELEF